MAGLRDLFGKYEAIIQSDIDAGEVDLGIAYNGTNITLMPFCQNVPGCCDARGGEYMTWCVPTGITQADMFLWGGGGGGAGACNCQQGVPGGSGAHAKKTINVNAGDEYELCVGWGAACTTNCVGEQGGKSYIIGTGLDNFCAEGGFGGKTCCYVYYRSECTISTCGYWYMDNCNKAEYFGADTGALGVLGFAFTACGCNDNNCWWKQALAYPGGITNKLGGNSVQRNLGNACNNEFLLCNAITGAGGACNNQVVGLGGPSATSCGGSCCYGFRGGPGMIKITYR
jgi:hypothetical protein